MTLKRKIIYKVSSQQQNKNAQKILIALFLLNSSAGCEKCDINLKSGVRHIRESRATTEFLFFDIDYFQQEVQFMKAKYLVRPVNPIMVVRS